MRLSFCTVMFLVFVVCGCSGGGSGDAEPAPLLTDPQDARSTVSEEDTRQEQAAGRPEEEIADEPEVRDGTLSEALFTNDTGEIGAEVPDEWDSRLTDEVWVLGGRGVGPGFTVSTDVQAWETTGYAPGAFITASASLGGEMSADQILDSEELDLSDGCIAGEREDFEDHGYEGRVQGWSNCSAGGKSVFNVVASENDGECVMMVQVGYVSDEERRLAEEILASFDSDCEKVREFEAGLEDFAAEEQTPTVAPEEAEIPALSCGGFGSQYDAQQFYDYVANEGERVILDPDANGFACDIELLGYPLEYIEDDPEPETQSSDPSAPGYVEPPLERDGICEGVGEIDPDCADAMEESLRTTNPEMFE